MRTKERLSASVDADLLEAGRRAVTAGRVDNLSTWVNEALRAHMEHERRISALDEFLAAYETEHGEITQREIEEAARSARARAVVIRGRKTDPIRRQRRVAESPD
jgi:Arc/MetJ-type ribon-helix-helix transcriptional regulator